MQPAIVHTTSLAQVCADTKAGLGLDVLIERLQEVLQEPELMWVLTRGNWHRLGGVVDADYQFVSDNIARWAERESDGDIDELVARYMDSGYFATRLAGKTHYFTFPNGDNAEDFIQIEIEELQEVLDRPLIDRDWYPDSLEEFLDPLDYPRLEPEPVGRPYYLFRRITPIADLIKETSYDSHALFNLRRFFEDWNQSSAHGELFCVHWILALREYVDRDGEYRFTAKPVTTFDGDMTALPPGEELHGAELARAIHSYDRQLGYPFAWYFNLLSHKAANYKLADAVLRDQMGAYEYIAARDLKVLRAWEERPYAV